MLDVVGWIDGSGVLEGQGWSILLVHWSAKPPGSLRRLLLPYSDGRTSQIDEFDDAEDGGSGNSDGRWK